MRIIDADRLTELIEKIVPQSALELGYLYQIREYIKQMPTVDREESVLQALKDVATYVHNYVILSEAEEEKLLGFIDRKIAAIKGGSHES